MRIVIHIDSQIVYWDLNLYQSISSIHVWVMKEDFVILHIVFKWPVRIHFEQNTAKNNDLLEKCFEQEFWIQFSTKHSVNVCLYSTLEWS